VTTRRVALGVVGALILVLIGLWWIGPLGPDVLLNGVPITVLSAQGPEPQPSDNGVPLAATSIPALVGILDATRPRVTAARCDAAHDYCWPRQKGGASRLFLAVAIGPENGCTTTSLVGAQLSGQVLRVIESSRRTGFPFASCPMFGTASDYSLIAVPLDRLPKTRLSIVVTYWVHGASEIQPGDGASTIIDLSK